jgi:hypothetical protein
VTLQNLAGILEQLGAGASAVVSCMCYLADLGDVTRTAAAPGRCGQKGGLAPKAYARIVRFQRAVGLLGGVRDGHTLADVAIECGYCDQSHLTRDFVALAGCTPTALMAEYTGEPGVRFLQDDGMAGSLPSVHDD